MIYVSHCEPSNKGGRSKDSLQSQATQFMYLSITDGFNCYYSLRSTTHHGLALGFLLTVLSGVLFFVTTVQSFLGTFPLKVVQPLLAADFLANTTAKVFELPLLVLVFRLVKFSKSHPCVCLVDWLHIGRKWVAHACRESHKVLESNEELISGTLTTRNLFAVVFPSSFELTKDKNIVGYLF